MKRRLFVSALLCLCLAGGGVATAPPPVFAARPEDQLRQAQKKIQAQEKLVAAIKKKKTTVLGSLEDVDRKIVLYQKNLRQAQARVLETQRQIKGLREEISALRKRIDRQKDAGGRRLASYYRFGKTGVMPVVFADSSLPEKFRNLGAMKRILEADWERLRGLHALAGERQQKEAELGQRLAEEGRLQEKIKLSLEEQKTARQDKDGLLYQIARDEQLHSKLLGELRQSVEALTRKIEQTGPGFVPAAAGALASQKGNLPWPVEGSICRKFGKVADPLLRVTINNHGIDIQTRPEAPVRAVWAGEVAFADWFRGYGKLMIVNHGAKSYTVLSHMSRLTKKKGDRVAPGDIVGYAGDTGSLEGSMVHFEIWHGGKPGDPLQWLRPAKGAYARGEKRAK